MKKGLKLWISSNHFDSPKKHIDIIKLKIDSLQQQLDTNLLDTDLHIEESNLTAQLEHWLALEESSLRNKSRDNGYSLEIKSSKFFHARIKSRQSKNHISHHIAPDGSYTTDIQQIKVAVPQFYEALFNHHSYWNVSPKLMVKRRLTQEASSWLVEEVSAQEIKMVIFQCNPHKTPALMVLMQLFIKGIGQLLVER